MDAHGTVPPIRRAGIGSRAALEFFEPFSQDQNASASILSTLSPSFSPRTKSRRSRSRGDIMPFVESHSQVMRENDIRKRRIRVPTDGSDEDFEPHNPPLPIKSNSGQLHQVAAPLVSQATVLSLPHRITKVYDTDRHYKVPVARISKARSYGALPLNRRPIQSIQNRRRSERVLQRIVSTEPSYDLAAMAFEHGKRLRLGYIPPFLAQNSPEGPVSPLTDSLRTLEPRPTSANGRPRSRYKGSGNSNQGGNGSSAHRSTIKHNHLTGTSREYSKSAPPGRDRGDQVKKKSSKASSSSSSSSARSLLPVVRFEQEDMGWPWVRPRRLSKVVVLSSASQGDMSGGSSNGQSQQRQSDACTESPSSGSSMSVESFPPLPSRKSTMDWQRPPNLDFFNPFRANQGNRSNPISIRAISPTTEMPSRTSNWINNSTSKTLLDDHQLSELVPENLQRHAAPEPRLYEPKRAGSAIGTSSGMRRNHKTRNLSMQYLFPANSHNSLSSSISNVVRPTLKRSLNSFFQRAKSLGSDKTLPIATHQSSAKEALQAVTSGLLTPGMNPSPSNTITPITAFRTDMVCYFNTSPRESEGAAP